MHVGLTEFLSGSDIITIMLFVLVHIWVGRTLTPSKYFNV